jgi:inosose dehydratase
MKTTRRDFLKTTAAVSALPFFTPEWSGPAVAPFPIASNSYNWFTFYRRSGKVWGQDWDACMAAYSQTGLQAYEGSFTSVEELNKLAPYLKKYAIQVPSLYVNSILHTTEDSEKSIQTVLAIAAAAKTLGTKIIVTNPSPIRWGGEELKSDEQLRNQASNLEKMGSALRKTGMSLAYHIHDNELKAGAREFHHMMLNTSPERLAFCFDIHWVYRGTQNSEVAVFDVLKLYGKRVIELHIRQSVNGIWSETFGEGDIDYKRLVSEMKKIGIKPHLVIEQCIEEKSPNTLTAEEAHIKDLAAVKEVFKPLL